MLRSVLKLGQWKRQKTVLEPIMEKEPKAKKKKNNEDEDEDEESVPREKLEMEDLIANNFVMLRKVAHGAFGEIILSYSLRDNCEVVVKREIKVPNQRVCQLHNESKVYQNLLNIPNTQDISGATHLKQSKIQGISRYFGFGEKPAYFYLVMDFLGPNLAQLFEYCGKKKFTLGTVCLIALQMFARIEYIHKRHYLHRDIKPENFCVGADQNTNVIHIIDFGLSKKYKTTKGHQHIPYREGRPMVGTMRYASINTLLGVEQSRRDDIMSIGYLLIYLVKGSLPWQGLVKSSNKQAEVTQKKIQIPTEVLCQGLPNEFIHLINYAKNLKFSEKPDYEFLKGLFARLLGIVIATYNLKKSEMTFDWCFDDVESIWKKYYCKQEAEKEQDEKIEKEESEEKEETDNNVKRGLIDSLMGGSSEEKDEKEEEEDKKTGSLGEISNKKETASLKGSDENNSSTSTVKQDFDSEKLNVENELKNINEDKLNENIDEKLFNIIGKDKSIFESTIEKKKPVITGFSPMFFNNQPMNQLSQNKHQLMKVFSLERTEVEEAKKTIHKKNSVNLSLEQMLKKTGSLKFKKNSTLQKAEKASLFETDIFDGKQIYSKFKKDSMQIGGDTNKHLKGTTIAQKRFSVGEMAFFEKETKVKLAKENLIRIQKESITKNYELIGDLGSGSYGSVKKVRHKKLKEIRAMKVIPKKNEIAKNEIEIMRKISHPNIVNIFDIYEDAKKYYIMMDYCEGGELFEAISEQGIFSEQDCAYIMKQVLSAVNYLHSKNIMHRDIKPENIMLTKKISKKNKKYDIKLIDFGTAKVYDRKSNETKFVGTSYYIAPEVIKENYNEKCDVWSCGVIMYILLSGNPPFNGNSNADIYNSIQNSQPYFHGEDWKDVTPEAINLLQNMLNKRPNKRYSAENCLNHKWFTMLDEKDGDKSQVVGKKIQMRVIDKMSGFVRENRLKQAVLQFISNQFNLKKEEEDLQALFKEFDLKQQGQISKDIFYKKLTELYGEIEGKEICDKIFEQLDLDGSGEISYDEFLSAMIDGKKILTQDRLAKAFKMFDKDGNGLLSVEEIVLVFGGDADYWTEIIKEVDEDHDGQVDFNQFKKLMGQFDEEKNKKKLGYN